MDEILLEHIKDVQIGSEDFFGEKPGIKERNRQDSVWVNGQLLVHKKHLGRTSACIEHWHQISDHGLLRLSKRSLGQLLARCSSNLKKKDFVINLTITLRSIEIGAHVLVAAVLLKAAIEQLENR